MNCISENNSPKNRTKETHASEKKRFKKRVFERLAKVRKKYYPKHQIYFSFQIGGDPRTVRETMIGTMFEDDNFEADQKMSADKKYQNLQKQLATERSFGHGGMVHVGAFVAPHPTYRAL